MDLLLSQELRARQPRIDKIRDWEKAYKGERDSKSYPYKGVANTAQPIVRKYTDPIVVRLIDTVWSQQKMWITRPKPKNGKNPFLGIKDQLEDSLDWWQKSMAHLRKKSIPVLYQSVKMGFSVLKIDWVSRKRCYYRYATEEEKNNDNIKKYSAKNGEKLIKDVYTVFEGADVFPISTEDVVYSSEATDLSNARMVGWRKYMRMPKIRANVNRGFYIKDSDKKILGISEIDDVKKERASNQKRDIVSSEKKLHEVWEIWLTYDVDNDGEEDEIVITYHPGSKTILRAIYNPIFGGWKPFQEFVYSPIEFSIEGEGTCEILEKLAVEIDTFHNMRAERLKQINFPPILARTGAQVDNNIKLHPGALNFVDDIENSIREIRFSDTYPSTLNEEMTLNKYASEAVGVTPAVMGQQTAERPVFRDTMTLLQEANKKIKLGIDNIRMAFSELGMKVIELYSQYEPSYRYYIQEQGQMAEKELELPYVYVRDNLEIEIQASSELMNKEVERETNMAIYQMLSDYFTKTAGMIQAILSPHIPRDFKVFLMKTSKLGARLIKRILKTMNIPDVEELVEEIDESIDVNKAMKASSQFFTPPPPEGGQQSQGGQGGQKPPPQQPPMGGR